MPWEKVCSLDEVAEGSMHTADIRGTPVLVVRGEQGIAVMPTSCPHMANALCEGFFDGCVLTCNKHLWQWSIPDGQPMGVAEQPLSLYKNETRDGALWVNFDGPLTYEHESE